MRYESDSVSRTASGLYVRSEQNVGLVAYSPYTGLIFVVHPDDLQDTMNWLNGRSEAAPEGTIRHALGYMWDEAVASPHFPMPHYLADKGEWEHWPYPKRFPILVNWFLTGNCPLECKYCDAEDLMRHSRREPDDDDIERIAERILTYRPLAVVLTGGEPLLSEHIENCIRLLHGRTGIIVDTNGLLLTAEMIELFKNYQVVVRISMDSPIPKINDSIRCFPPRQSLVPSLKKTVRSPLARALQSLCACLKEDLPVSVQTVATGRTISDLPALGDRLYALGMRYWRVHLVSLPRRHEQYKILRVKPKAQKNAFTKLRRAHRTRWQAMDLQIVPEINRDSVVIVAPDGEFLTESNTGRGKIALDSDHPFGPDTARLFWNVSSEGHARRYLGDPEMLQGSWSND